ncbi:glucan endo-1,3-beta-glucosidase GVI [Canna indica]|uniref:Glucan endo-1,3-beta-glucosidase GVI n=1 Tax=Canna indica TaxID=4628 RepID=A0AAQ3JRH0_9LILI|nr:glucan endo-1,3-beta-glucosidase GVI [Canna indica]
MDNLLFICLLAVGIVFSTSTTLFAVNMHALMTMEMGKEWHADAGGAGVNYGLLGNNLPPRYKVVELLKKRNIRRIRLFLPDGAALNALHGSGIEVIVGTTNDELPKIAQDPAAAAGWVHDVILPHAAAVKFRCISAGNEVWPSNLAQYVGPAMENLDKAVAAVGLKIPVSTAVTMDLTIQRVFKLLAIYSVAMSESALI